MTNTYLASGALGLGLGLSLHYALRTVSEQAFADAVADLDFQRAEESLQPVFFLAKWGVLVGLGLIGLVLVFEQEPGGAA